MRLGLHMLRRHVGSREARGCGEGRTRSPLEALPTARPRLEGAPPRSFRVVRDRELPC